MTVPEPETRPTLPLTVFLVSAALLLLVALAVFHGLRAERQASVEAALQAVAELKIGQLDTWLNERTADVALFGSDSQLASDFNRWLSQDGQDEAALAEIQARLAAMKRNVGYDTIALFDAAGNERIRSEGIASQAEFGPQASTAMRQDQPQLVDFHRQPGQPIRIGMVGPIKRIAAQGTQIVGAIYLGAPAQRQVFPLLLHWPLPSQTGETVLARPEGESILNIVTRKAPPMTIRIPIDQPGLLSARAVRGESGIQRGSRDYAGDPVLGYAARVPGTPWVLVAKQDTREVDAPLRQWALWVVLVTLLLLGAAGGVNWSWWRAQTSHWRARILQQGLDQALATQRATAALFASEEVNRVTFAQAAIGIAHVGVDGRWLRVNHKLCEILGYPIEELPRIALQDIEHPDDLESDTAAMHKLLAGERPVDSVERRYVRKDRSLVWINRTISLVRGTDGEALHFIFLVEDIAARKQLEAERSAYRIRLEAEVGRRTQELETANADLESFSYSVSHDLRAPLRAIDGFSAILREDYAPQLDAEGLRLFGVVSDNARKMAQLIDDILALSRAGRMDLELAQLDMNGLVDAVWAGLAQQRAGRPVEFHRADLPSVCADRRALQQVWQNLLDNALKFSRHRDPARIEVGAERRHDLIWFEVKDNGAGFNTDYRGKLFGLFQRLHGMDEFAGTGVGLAIVKRFVQKHGGQVAAEGAVNVGARFRFGLPVRPDQALSGKE
jgi:PAS domain S-box-containing protein